MATTKYVNRFEGGTADGALTSANSGGGSGDQLSVITGTGASWAYKTAAGLVGALGARCTLGTGTSYLRWTKTDAGGRGVARRPLNIPSNPSATANVMSIRTGGGTTPMGAVQVTTSGQIQAYISSAITASRYTLTTNHQYWVELAVIKGTGSGDGTIELRVYDSDGTTLLNNSGAGWSSNTVNTGTTDPTDVRFGENTTAMGWTTEDFDDIQFAITDNLTYWLGPVANAAPTVTGSPDVQNLTAGDTFSVTWTASDTDGTVTSRASAFDLPTSGAPSITGGTTATTTGTAPAAPFLGILRQTVTDNGEAPGFDTVEIRVPTTGNLLPVAMDATSKTGTWTKVGGVATDGGTLRDTNDAHYIRTDDLTSTDVIIEVRLDPATVRSTGKATVRVKQSAAGTINCRVRLYSGATQIKEWTGVTVTTSWADVELTLTTGEVATITDSGDLRVRFLAKV